MTPMTVEDARAEVTRRLGRRRGGIADYIWEGLEEEGLVDGVCHPNDEDDQEEALKFLVKKVEIHERMIRREREEARKRKAREPLEIPPDETAIARSRIHALEAAQLEDVAGFRREVLRGKLVKPKRLAEWTRKKNEEQGEPDASSPRINVYLPAEKKTTTLLLAREGPLARLAPIAKGLSERYGWSEPESATFVVTGYAPIAPLLKATTRTTARVWTAKPADYVITTRIVLDVDPRVSPKKVMSFYARLRRREGISRSRTLTEEHAKLAVFAAKVNDGRSWAEAFETYREEHPESYLGTETPLEQFARDARDAHFRVTGRELGWKNPAGRRPRAGKSDSPPPPSPAPHQRETDREWLQKAATEIKAKSGREIGQRVLGKSGSTKGKRGRTRRSR